MIPGAQGDHNNTRLEVYGLFTRIPSPLLCAPVEMTNLFDYRQVAWKLGCLVTGASHKGPAVCFESIPSNNQWVPHISRSLRDVGYANRDVSPVGVLTTCRRSKAGQLNQQARPGDASPEAQSGSLDSHSHASGGHPGAYALELAIPINAVAGAFDGLRQNLIVGLIASIILLISVAVIGLCAPRYVRGRYLESEMHLARRIQGDLQPKKDSISPFVEFAGSSVAADQVGGDFYDIFEAESGKIAIVLGDVSGKGVPAALLVSVLHRAIRSSTASQHEFTCERINRMLCEQTAGERFMFWGVFDPVTRILRYVNAGHAAPMLVRRGQLQSEPLDDGGPVLGVLPDMRYSAGTVVIEDDDTLILYSDGISEASNQNDKEFGDDCIKEIVSSRPDSCPGEVCERIMTQVNAFADARSPADDRTLLVVKFLQSQTALPQPVSNGQGIVAIA